MLSEVSQIRPVPYNLTCIWNLEKQTQTQNTGSDIQRTDQWLLGRWRVEKE